jgi:hypothetical protein
LSIRAIRKAYGRNDDHREEKVAVVPQMHHIQFLQPLRTPVMPH